MKKATVLAIEVQVGQVALLNGVKAIVESTLTTGPADSPFQTYIKFDWFDESIGFAPHERIEVVR